MNARPVDIAAVGLALASVGLMLFSALAAQSADLVARRGDGSNPRHEFPERRVGILPLT